MTGDDGNGSVEPDEAPAPDPGEGADPAPWLLRHKVGLPDAIEGYVERPELEGRCALLERRLTVLHAPGGFGKTALLARACRALRGPAGHCAGGASRWRGSRSTRTMGPGRWRPTSRSPSSRPGSRPSAPPARGTRAARRRRIRRPTVRRSTGSSCCCARSRATARRACWRSTRWSDCAARRPPPRSTRCCTGGRTISMSGWRSGSSRRGWSSPCSRSKGARRR